MGRILVTGSTDGLGLAAAQDLISRGHEVWAHARDAARAREVAECLAGARGILVGDLAKRNETVSLAREAAGTGTFDAIIHNAGIGSKEPSPDRTSEGIPKVLAVNAFAPYLLTSLIPAPGRLVYITSGMHTQGDVTLANIAWRKRRWDPLMAYADSKLLMITLAFAVARLWPGTPANAVDPGWVPTKMAAGDDAPDDMSLGHVTQVWLACGEEPEARRTGLYMYHDQEIEALPLTRRVEFQNRVLKVLAGLTGVELPRVGGR